MSVTRRLGGSRRAGMSPTVVIDPAGVWADVPVAGDDGTLRCSLRAIYRVSDPLVVSLVVGAPSGAAVTEAIILRSGLIDAIEGRPVSGGSVVVAPLGARLIQLILAEGRASIGVVLPRDLIEDFLAATRTVVGTDDIAEAEACSRAAWALGDLERAIAAVRSPV